MILITGASGKTGKTIVQALAAKGQQVRALVHRAEQEKTLRQLGAVETSAGDIHNRALLMESMSQVSAVYHICPNVSKDEFEIGEMVINSAKAAGVERFVYHSVLHPHVEDMPHHWFKMRVEELLFKSALNFTILQPVAYMQNILGYWNQINNQGLYPVPYPPETRLGMVDLANVAEAAAEVLTTGGHTNAIYELCGSEALSQVEVADILSRKLNRTVKAERVLIEIWEVQARGSGMDEYAIGTLIKMFNYYEMYGFMGNPRTLSGLIGHSPTTFSEFIDRTLLEK
ncbi:MAG: SDR family oxidoreductase [Anaerolineaceae bacterium]